MRGETILCIATRVWHSLWRDSQPIMSRLAKQNRVLYFEPGRNPDRRHSAEMWRNWPNLFCLRARTLDENLILIPTPPSLPVMRRHLPRSVLQVTTPWVTRINARVLIRHVHWAMRAYDVKDPILWLYSPYHVDLVGQLGAKLACYFRYDDYPSFVQNQRVREFLREYDTRLSGAVDVVFTTSRSQWARCKADNPSTFFVPNAVDFDLFNRALAPNGSLPPDIAVVPRPIIGYAGWLGYQIDTELLRLVADTYPDYSVVLVGPDELPCAADREQLRARANVFFLGRKEREELPDYLQAFDAALIPYTLAGYTLTAYPLKLHEYLAAGRAVVSVNLPELQRHSQVVRIADSNGGFIRQIRDALYDYSPQAIESRVAVARENTWDQRVAEMCRMLQHHLSAKSRS